ncbi:5'-methylthioadenosine/S-adenosylhomocysteine nucleosidase, partial [Turicibacter sanguinis]|nr:5'-methylthioadenosine/S-adenosylhomocysteine nucleosidase [Turicibacter sanguinis]
IEMEATAVAQVCHQYQKPFIILRALSDIAGKESHISFNEFIEVAAKESSEMVTELVSLI